MEKNGAETVKSFVEVGRTRVPSRTQRRQIDEGVEARGKLEEPPRAPTPTQPPRRAFDRFDSFFRHLFFHIGRGLPLSPCAWARKNKMTNANSIWSPAEKTGECEAGKKTHHGDGYCCHFPFVYDGKIYNSCTAVDSKIPWCSLTSNFQVHKQWGFCVDGRDERLLKNLVNEE